MAMDSCPKCGGKVIKCGFAIRSGGKKQKYQCKECGYIFLEEKEKKVVKRL